MVWAWSVLKKIVMVFVGIYAIAAAFGFVGFLLKGEFLQAILMGLISFVLYKLFLKIKMKTLRSQEVRVRQAEEIQQIKAGLRKVANVIEEAADNAGRERIEKKERIARIDQENTIGKRIYVRLLGSTSLHQKEDAQLTLWVSENEIVLTDENSSFEKRIPMNSIAKMDISGPGKVTTNMGVVGGGIGAEGVLEGVAAAAAINALTTRTTVKTVLHVATENSEFWLLSKATPETLRMILSRAFLIVEGNSLPVRQSSLAQEIMGLAKLKDQGVLTEDEYVRAKSSIIEGRALSNG